MKKNYHISVKLLSALHINGGADVNGNRITVKMNGKSYIPASLFKGMVRESFTKLWRVFGDPNDPECTGKSSAEAPCRCMPCRMFGKAGFQRSRIYFDHLDSDQELQYMWRSNVSIDRHLRKAVDEALVFTEVVERYAGSTFQPTVFSGDMTVHYPVDLPPDQLKLIEAILVEAVREIHYLGLNKSRGLGFVESRIDCPDGGWLCANK